MTDAQNAAKAMGAGTDLNCGNGWDKQGDCRGDFSRAHGSPCHGYTAVPAAIEQGLATEAQLDTIVGRSLGLLTQGVPGVPQDPLGALQIGKAPWGTRPR